MKKSLVIVAFTLSMSSQAGAEEATDYDQKICELESSLAYQIMSFRQSGSPMHEVLQASVGDDLKSVVRDAYDTQQFQSEYAQGIIKTEFAKLRYYKCLDRMGVKF